VIEADLPASEQLAATYAQDFHSHATAG